MNNPVFECKVNKELKVINLAQVVQIELYTYLKENKAHFESYLPQALKTHYEDLITIAFDFYIANSIISFEDFIEIDYQKYFTRNLEHNGMEVFYYFLTELYPFNLFNKLDQLENYLPLQGQDYGFIKNKVQQLIYHDFQKIKTLYTEVDAELNHLKDYYPYFLEIKLHKLMACWGIEMEYTQSYAEQLKTEDIQFSTDCLIRFRPHQKAFDRLVLQYGVDDL